MHKPVLALLALLMLGGCGVHTLAPTASRPTQALHAASAVVPNALAATIAHAVAPAFAPGKGANILVISAEPSSQNPDELWVTGMADYTEPGKRSDEVNYACKYYRSTGKVADFEAIYWFEEDGPGSTHDLLLDALKKKYHGSVSGLHYEPVGYDGHYTFKANVSHRSQGKTTKIEVTGSFDRFLTSNTYYGQHPEGPFQALKERVL